MSDSAELATLANRRTFPSFFAWLMNNMDSIAGLEIFQLGKNLIKHLKNPIIEANIINNQ